MPSYDSCCSVSVWPLWPSHCELKTITQVSHADTIYRSLLSPPLNWRSRGHQSASISSCVCTWMIGICNFYTSSVYALGWLLQKSPIVSVEGSSGRWWWCWRRDLRLATMRLVVLARKENALFWASSALAPHWKGKTFWGGRHNACVISLLSRAHTLFKNLKAVTTKLNPECTVCANAVSTRTITMDSPCDWRKQ